jgi:hypothetical protein
MMDRNRITGAAHKMSGKLRSVASQASDEAAARAEAAYGDALDTGARVFDQARGRMMDLADDTLDNGQRLYGQGMQVLTRQAGTHPLAVIAAAGLVGAALAIAFMSSSRR